MIDSLFKSIKHTQIDLNAYLLRIGIDSNSQLSLKKLNQIHRQHLLSVPFENLDIHYKRRIKLDQDAIYNKIVHERRGGFCYELNTGLFLLLNSLGFQTSFGSAQIYKDGAYSAEFDHMILFTLVNNQIYLCDVGFGDHFSQPKQMVLNSTQLDFNCYYRFETDPDDYWILKKSTDNSAFFSVYKFKPVAREFIEFIPRCDYQQDSENSVFRKQKLITQLTIEGRIALTDRVFKENTRGIFTETPINSEDDFFLYLKEKFNISEKALIQQMLNQ